MVTKFCITDNFQTYLKLSKKYKNLISFYFCLIWNLECIDWSLFFLFKVSGNKVVVIFLWGRLNPFPVLFMAEKYYNIIQKSTVYGDRYFMETQKMNSLEDIFRKDSIFSDPSGQYLCKNSIQVEHFVFSVFGHLAIQILRQWNER